MIPVKICYTYPAENEEVRALFRPFAERFVDTYFKHRPGHLHVVTVVVNGTEVSADIVELFRGIPVEFKLYEGNGMDLGSQQMVASEGDHFQVNMTSRMYFHREGWLDRLVEGRETYGPGLYGMTASHEGGRLHICTRGHAYDAKDFREYPHQIVNRDQGVFFECGEGCLLEWYQARKQPVFVVGWNGEFGDGKCAHCHELSGKNFQDYFTHADGFRNGDQRNVLCFDKHTDAFRDADDQEKSRLTSLCRGY